MSQLDPWTSVKSAFEWGVVRGPKAHTASGIAIQHRREITRERQRAMKLRPPLRHQRMNFVGYLHVLHRVWMVAATAESQRVLTVEI